MNRKSIRKIVVGVLLCLIINLAYEVQSVIPAFAADFVVVNATNVNVRSQPSTSSKSYGKVSKGTPLARMEERADGWSCIDYAGTPAYIKTEFLAPYTIAAGAIAGAGTVTANTTAVSSTPAPAVAETKSTGASGSYIANMNTHKFHYPSCSSVSKMSEKNKLYFNGSRDELINKGYVPCQRCNP